MNDHPVPVPTPETLPFWEGTKRGVLTIQHCLACGRWVFHPRIRCPHCSADALEWREASGHGSLWSYIIVHRPEPSFAAEAPYVVGVVTLEEGPRMAGIIRGVDPTPEALPLGLPLRVFFEPRGDQMVAVWRVGAYS